MIKRRMFIFLVISFSLCVVEPQRAAVSTRTYAFINGKWFDGQRFAQRTFYAEGGMLTSTKPVQVDTTIDLAGKFVVPPFGEAHNHNVGYPANSTESAQYLRDGIFYVMVQSPAFPPRSSAEETESGAVVDAICAGATLTPSGSHVVLINERSADRGNFPGILKNQLDGKTHTVINNAHDVEAKLPSILRTKPPFIKLILAFSEEFDTRRLDSTYVGKRGLDPGIVPLIVQKAHEAGVRVSAHIETAEDFHIAIEAGVDIIAHMPGSRLGKAAGFDDKNIERWFLKTDDVERAAKQKSVVLTTILANKAILNPTSEDYTRLRQIYAHNLTLLKSKGVVIAIGSDFYQGTNLPEAFLLGRQSLLTNGVEPLGAFTNQELLALWSQVTPRVIFPNRLIGELVEGAEASFVVLSGNPIEDFKNVTKIELRIKQGVILR